MTDMELPSPEMEAMQTGLKKAFYGGVKALAIGVMTGLICGAVAMPIATFFLDPVTATHAFGAFGPTVMGLFIGLTSAVAAFLTNGFDGAVEAYSNAKALRSKARAIDTDITVAIPTIAYVSPLTSPTHGKESAIILGSPPGDALLHPTPTTHSLMDSNHAGRLLEAPEIATMRLH